MTAEKKAEPSKVVAICSKCGGKMYVTRRSPHPVIVKGEKQVLTCHACGAQENRGIDESGERIA